MPFVTAIRYDNDGRILGWAGMSGKNMDITTMRTHYPDCNLLESSVEPDQATQYIDTVNETLEDCAALTASWNKTTIVANGTDEAVLSTLPNPCTIYRDGVEIGDVTDGSYELAAVSAGEYVITADAVGYIRESWTIEATAS